MCKRMSVWEWVSMHCTKQIACVEACACYGVEDLTCWQCLLRWRERVFLVTPAACSVGLGFCVGLASSLLLPVRIKQSPLETQLESRYKLLKAQSPKCSLLVLFLIHVIPSILIYVKLCGVTRAAAPFFKRLPLADERVLVERVQVEVERETLKRRGTSRKPRVQFSIYICVLGICYSSYHPRSSCIFEQDMLHTQGHLLPCIQGCQWCTTFWRLYIYIYI